MNVEEVVRDKFNLFKDMMSTSTSDENEDYLYLLNLSTDDEIKAISQDVYGVMK